MAEKKSIRLEARWLAARQLAAALEQMTEEQLAGFAPAEGVEDAVKPHVLPALVTARNEAAEFLRNMSVKALEDKKVVDAEEDAAEMAAFEKSQGGGNKVKKKPKK